MWKLMDSNKIVGTKCKVEAYKNHLRNLENVKAGVKVEKPWTPSFSLSKRTNKYSKMHKQEIMRQNQNLLTRMLRIDEAPMRNTICNLPPNLPSNTHTFMQMKSRERKASTDQIKKENSKIFDKIINTNSDYNRITLKNEWNDVLKYRENLLRKEHVADYNRLAKQELQIERSRVSRPRTAFTPLQSSQ